MLESPIVSFLTKIPLGRRLIRVLRGIFGRKEKPVVPIKAGFFQPFISAVPQAERRLWARTSEAERLNKLVQEAQNSHIIVTGSSGAGKSTLVRELYRKEYVDEETTEYYEFLDYDQVLTKVLGTLRCNTPDVERLRQRTYASIGKALREHPFRATDSLDEIGAKPEAQEAWNQLATFLQAFLGDKNAKGNYLFVFDQVERYLFIIGQAFATTGGAANGLELYLTKRTLGMLREAPNCRTIIIIREDFLYRSMSFLLTKLGDPPTSSQDVFRLFLCEGINADNSPQAVADVSTAFQKAVPFLAHRFEEFARLTGISTSLGANPFLAQLCGFMIEHFYRHDRRVSDLLEKGKSSTEVLPLFFDYVEAEFMSTAAPDSTNVELLRAVLFGIALENKSTGLPVAADRVARVSHVPTEFARSVSQYLLPRQIVTAEEQQEGVAIRFAHDVLAEFVLHSDDMSFEPALKESMTKISENHVRSKELTSVRGWAHFIDDFARPNIGLVAIWSFYVFGLYRIAAAWGLGVSVWGLDIRLDPSQCAALEDRIRALLPAKELFAPVSCEDSRWYYPFVFAMHCLWVTYIYYIDRNYIQHVARSRIVRFVSALMPAIGVAFGMLFAFSPIVHVLPVTVVGTIYAFILMYLTFSWRVGAPDFSRVNLVRGSYTLANMVFTLALVVLVWATYPDGNPFMQWGEEKAGFLLAQLGMSPQQETALLRAFWLYATVFLMMYYWSSLRVTHQSTIAAAKWLALFDRSRVLGGQRAN